MKKLIVLTAVFAMVFAGTALAADWNFYGSSRVTVQSSTQDKDLTGTGNDYSTTGFFQQGNSRIGANVAAGDVSGRFEYGNSGGNANIRLLYGTWNFGSGKMVVGQLYNPTYYGLSNQVLTGGGDNGLAGFGAPFSRRDAIEFHFGGFKIAAVEPSAPGSAGAGYTATRGTIPKLEAAYNGAFGPVNLHLSGGMNTWESYNPTTNNGKSVTSWVGQVMAKYNAGPFMVGGSFYYGSNLGNYGWNVAPDGDATAKVVAGEFKDTTSMAFTVVVGFTINDMMGVEGGYGYNVNSYDDGYSKDDDNAMMYYVQLPLTLADGVFIIPEVTIADHADDVVAGAKVKGGKETLLGAKFQINF
jgi:hypothetical protein